MQMFVAKKVDANGNVTYADVSAKSRIEAAIRAGVLLKYVWLNTRKH